MFEPTFRVTLILTKPEAEALSKRAQAEGTDLRTQARYMLLSALGVHPTEQREEVSQLPQPAGMQHAT